MPRAKGGSIPPPRINILPGHGGLITTLNDNDVLSGRGGRINNHPGNIAFRTIVEDYKREYLDPRIKKLEKAHVAARLVAQIRSMNPPGRFLKEDGENPGMYIEIGDQKAWKKAGQALREDAPEIRKEIDDDLEIEVDQYTPQPINPYPRVLVGIPPSVSYSPSNAIPPHPSPASGHRPDPPESEGVTGYRQPPLPYYDNDHANGVRPMHYSGRGPPPPQHHYPVQQHYPPNQMMAPRGNPSNYYAPPNAHHYPPQPHPQQPFPQSQYPHQAPHDQMNGPAHNYYRGMHPPPQRQPQFTSGPRNRFGAPISSSDRRGDFPSLAMSTATDFTMSDVSEFTPVTIDPDRTRAAYEKDTSLDYLKETTQPLDGMRQSSSDKSSLAVSELSMSGLKASAMIPEPAPERNESNLSMSFGLSRTYSFPDLFLSTGELAAESMTVGESDKDNSDPSNGTKHRKTKSGRLFRQQSNHRHSSSETSSIFSVDSLKMGRAFHPVRGRTNTDVSGLQDAMSLMSMDHQSLKSESSWLEAAKSMQSITSDMNPWASTEGNSLRHINGADDGSVRSLLSDMSNDLNALDLADLPLLPPIQHAESGFEDSASLIHRPDP